MSEYAWYVGVDWGTQEHAVWVLDRTGACVGRRRVAHTGPAVAECVQWLRTTTGVEAAAIAIAVEQPRGSVVETFVEQGFAVFAINPKQVDRFRDRFTIAGAKDDDRDAHVLADALRTDAAAFRRVRLDDPQVIELREWSRLDEELCVELTRQTNRLRDLLLRAAPALLTLCPAADESWCWALLRVAPTPAAQRRLTVRRLARLLQAHRIRRVTAAEVHAALQVPPVPTAPGVVDAVAAHIGVLLPRVELLAAQRQHSARELKRLLEAITQAAPGDQREHRDVTILLSMPGAGIRTVATMLAEAAQPLAERAYHTVRARMGVAPVTKRSGKRCQVVMRHACQGRLRNAAHHWALGSLTDPASRAYYDRLRQRGCTLGRALRSVADRLLRLLCALLESGQCYDPMHPQRQLVSAPRGA